jgi:Binding-protein-dependent transport system inner membrane component/ABC transporter
MNTSARRRALAFHVVPNALPPMMVQMSLNLGWAMLNAAGLSFIGLGIRPPTPEWGILVAESALFILSGEWWIALFPGLALMVAVFCFNLLGDGLRDIHRPEAAHVMTMPEGRDVPLLKVDDLSVEFRTRDGIVKAREEVSFSVGKGETLGVVGESGSGKSVTALAVLGLLASGARITAGSAVFGGLDLLQASGRQFEEYRGREVSMIFQNPRTALNPIRTIGRHGCRFYGRCSEGFDRCEREMPLLRAVGDAHQAACHA